MGIELSGRGAAPWVVVLFGPNAVGKTTLATAIAEALPRTALIEVDALRYQRRGGLVAWSRGAPPSAQPAEYLAQCWQGVELAVMQARYYHALGVSACVEGLEDECRPGSAWTSMAWSGLRVTHILARCGEGAARARLAGRGVEFTAEHRASHARWGALAGSFDQVVDTDAGAPAALAAAVVARLGA